MIGSCWAPIVDAATEGGRNIAPAKQRQLEWESLDLRQVHLATLWLNLVGLPVGLILPCASDSQPSYGYFDARYFHIRGYAKLTRS